MIKQTLSTMPRRNLQKYKVLPLSKLVKMKVPEEDRMSGETVNDHLKTLNSLIKFAYERDYIAKPYAVSMIKKTTSGRDERVALDVDTIMHTIATAKTARLTDSFALLYLTGLRPSEVTKCKLTSVDGIRCFDLRDRTLQLKSKGSYRLIPVHHAIKEPERLLESFKSMSSQYMNRQFDVAEGTLYSLRHSFATELAAKGVEPHIISELLGHSHQGMTLGRYVKGFPVKVLKEAVDKLNISLNNF
jgi:integrase